MIIYVLGLLFVFFKAGLCINSHQFHFSGGNVAYGDIPRLVHIVGYWYIHRNDTNFQELFDKGYSTDDLRGVLYVCKEHIERKLISQSSIAAKREKILKVNRMLENNHNPNLVTPYLQDLTGCQTIILDDDKIKTQYENGERIKVKRFDIYHNFTTHSSILFADPWGLAAFHYRTKHKDSHKLKYCENDEISFPVVFNKRPICPRPALQSTVVENGLLTVYKPMIESETTTAYRCQLRKTYIQTFKGFTGYHISNDLKTEVVDVINEEICWEWIRTRKCDIDKHGIRDKFVNTKFVSGEMSNISNTQFATTNSLEKNFEWMYRMQYTVLNCVVDIGYMRTTPPYSNMVSAWGDIGTNHLYESNYTQPGGEVIVWEAFGKTDLCNYVPHSSFEAKRITYNSKDFLEQDPNFGANQLYHFVSDAEKSVYTSDNTQETSHELYNCIDDAKDQILYTINDGLILSWLPGARLNEDNDNDDDNDEKDDVDLLDVDITKSQTEYHAHYAYSDITRHVNAGKDVEISTVTGGADESPCTVGEGNDIQSSICLKSYALNQMPNPSNNISNEDFIPKRQIRLKPKVSSKDKATTLFSVVNYLAYKFREYQNHEVVRRAQSWCENQQHLYDIQQLLARTSPSVIISSYLNRPVQAENIGNGVYGTHYCNVIEDYIVIDNLFVANEQLAPKIRKPLHELYAKAGVTINPKHCFTMPIIIFREHMGLSTYKIGQMNTDHTVSTIQMPWVEECKFDRYFLHYIGDKIHIFYTYKKVGEAHIDQLFDHASRLKENVKHISRMKSGSGENNQSTTRSAINPILENIRFIDIYTQYQPSMMKPIVLGFQDTKTYGYKMQRRIISSLEGIISYLNSARFDEKLYKNRLTANATVFDDDSLDILPVFESIVDGVATGVKIISDGVFDVAEHIVDTGGGFIEHVLGTGTGVLEKVGDFFSGGLVKLILPMLAVAAVALFVYYLIKEKLLSNNSSRPMNQSYVQPPNQAFLYPNMQQTFSNAHFFSEKSKKIKPNEEILRDEYIEEF